MILFKFFSLLISMNLSHAQDDVFSDLWQRDREGDLVLYLNEELVSLALDENKREQKLKAIKSAEKEKVAEEKVELVEYVVVEGDNLSKIALKLYGNEQKWKEIYFYNKSFFTSNKLAVGVKLKVRPATNPKK